MLSVALDATMVEISPSSVHREFRWPSSNGDLGFAMEYVTSISRIGGLCTGFVMGMKPGLLMLGMLVAFLLLVPHGEIATHK